MRVIDPGHTYALPTLDSESPWEVILQFVKREGEKFPGNLGHYSGTTMQEVLRALIERATYVNRQTPCPETETAIGLLKSVIVLFEIRAARRHGRELDVTVDEVVYGETCPVCLHVGCGGH